ncbi:MAG: 50S ribosomal protein L5, partial [candidate division NC10 bacterium]
MAEKAERKARAQGAAEAAKAGKGEKAPKGKPEGAPAPQVPRVPARLRERYRSEIVPALIKQFNYTNRMQVPEVEKVVINMGLGEAVGNVKVIDA